LSKWEWAYLLKSTMGWEYKQPLAQQPMMYNLQEA